MSAKKDPSHYRKLFYWQLLSFPLLPILLLKLSVIPERYELLVYCIAVAGLAVAGYFGRQAATDRGEHYENLGGAFFLAGILFITADINLFGERGLTAILALILLGLGGYYSWRARVEPSEG